MSDVVVVEHDILELGEPQLSATSDIPVIETKPDSQAAKPEVKPEPKPAPKEEAKAEVAVVDTNVETKTPEESATPETPDDSSASDEPKKAKGVQKRIDELVRQREEEKAEKLRLLAIVEGYNKPKAEPEAQPDDQEPQKPARESFGTTDEYVAALADYADAKAAWSSERAVKSALAEEARKTEQKQIEAGQNAAREAYAKRVEDVSKEYPDYKEVAESPDVTVSIPMAHAILQSEHGPKIAYFLGKNPGEAKRIAQLSPPVQLMEMGLIVARLTAPAAKEVTPAPTKPVISAAPKPLKPIEPKSEPVSKDPQDMNMDEYAEMVRQREKKARAGART